LVKAKEKKKKKKRKRKKEIQNVLDYFLMTFLVFFVSNILLMSFAPSDFLKSLKPYWC
jgi:hypothetical protein